jgi:DNA (cytosine-5)-methyltransferase 1
VPIGPGKPEVEPVFTFVDLFAGIGGIRLGLEGAGGKCVYTVESDRFAMETYSANFGVLTPDGRRMPEPVRNIYAEHASDMGQFDVLAAGFPCQPFSIAGVSKKASLGRVHGFEDETSGNLFFEIMRIVDGSSQPPPVLFLENVKNLTGHDRGNTFKVIRREIEDRDYVFQYRVIDAQQWVPQHRERTFMICTQRSFLGDEGFRFPETLPGGEQPTLESVIEPKAVDSKYTLSEHLWGYLVDYAAKHRAAGNGFGYGLTGRSDVARTLSARYYKDGSEILFHEKGREILDRDDAGNALPRPGLRPRRLTPRECARLMGYPDTFNIPVSDTQAYRQFGNSVVVPVVEALAKELVNQIARTKFTEARHGRETAHQEAPAVAV